MRSFGTNTFFTATLMLPLPRKPMVSQSCNSVTCDIVIDAEPYR
jgi:hypothetical protein